VLRSQAVHVLTPSHGRAADSADNALSSWTLSIDGSIGAMFAVDPAQDLLVTRASAPVNGSQITCLVLSLRTGQPHPLCSSARAQGTRDSHVISIPAPEEWVADYAHYTRCQISGPVLGISFADSNRCVHVVVSWTDGTLRAVLSLPRSPRDSAVMDYSGFALIAEDVMLVGVYDKLTRTPAIRVYVLIPASPDSSLQAGFETTHVPALVSTYELPRPVAGHVARLKLSPFETSKLHKHPSETEDDAPPSLLLKADPFAGLMHVEVSLWPAPNGMPMRRDEFYTPLWPFHRAAELHLSEPASATPKAVSWNDWGPSLTRWINYGFEPAPDTDDEGAEEQADAVVEDPPNDRQWAPPWALYTGMTSNREGSRIIFPRHVIDFAPFDLARTLHQHTLRGDETTESGTMKIVTRTTEISTPLYEEPIVSRLPYLQTRLNMSLHADDLMLVGETIVGLGVRHARSSLYSCSFLVTGRLF
jgi:hypothetical protein